MKRTRPIWHGYINIPDDELAIQLQMCDVLGLRPMFIVRMMPKTWAWQRVIRPGGYVMMLGVQFYCRPALKSLNGFETLDDRFGRRC